MLQTTRILVSATRPAACVGIAATLLAILAGCGQPGQLYLPTEPATAKRATLPQSLWPVMPAKTNATADAKSDGKGDKTEAPTPSSKPTPSTPNPTEKPVQP